MEATETYKRCVAYKYYLLQVQASSYEDATPEEQESLPKLYLKPGHLVELDEFSCTHGSGELNFHFYGLLFYGVSRKVQS